MSVDLPDTFLDAIVERLAPLMAERIAASSARPDQWLDVKQAAEYISAPVSRIYDLRAQRKVDFRKDGSRLLTRRSWLDEYLEGQK